jgi:AbrB family looped-hinge helix DNA binding protein
MSKKRKSDVAGADVRTCCRVEAVVSVDERGQMVLPKDVRERVGIKTGEKFAVICCGEGGCCLALVKAEAVGSMMKGMLGPLFDNVAGLSK